MLPQLPIGQQDFRGIRETEALYVDKTRQIHRLLTAGKYFFLSRPRRFGKSLTLSTIKELFSGSRELFEGKRKSPPSPSIPTSWISWRPPPCCSRRAT